MELVFLLSCLEGRPVKRLSREFEEEDLEDYYK